MTQQKVKNYSGIITALVTPFKKGEIDWDSLQRLVKAQIDAGIHGFVINGTTGESPTLRETEREKIFQTVSREVKSSDRPEMVLIMGTGSNSTELTIEATQQAEELGADAALVVVPYYNRPPQRGLFQHFQKVSECSSLDIILYNVPSRTSCSLEAQTIIELSSLERMRGIKEASGDLEFGLELINNCHSDFFITSGDDASFLDLMAIGGCGVISVAAQLAPHLFLNCYKEARAQKNVNECVTDFESFREINRLLFKEANPIGIKMALHLVGLIDHPEMRLPLVELSENWRSQLQQKLKEAGRL